jgi:hypothetical protein
LNVFLVWLHNLSLKLLLQFRWLQLLPALPYISRYYITYRGAERCRQAFSGKHEGRRPLERPKRRWDDNIKRIFGKWDVEHKLDRSSSG